MPFDQTCMSRTWNGSKVAFNIFLSFMVLRKHPCQFNVRCV